MRRLDAESTDDRQRVTSGAEVSLRSAESFDGVFA
jgi:hypothetical protein